MFILDHFSVKEVTTVSQMSQQSFVRVRDSVTVLPVSPSVFPFQLRQLVFGGFLSQRLKMFTLSACCGR